MENTKFVFIEKYWAYFWSEHNKFLSASEACEILMIKKKLLHKMRVDWTIQEYSDITYWHGGKENCFNLLKDNSILQAWTKAEIPKEIEKLILNLSSWNKTNAEYIHKLILFKWLNPNSILLPALVCHGAWATGKWTLATMLTTIFSEENVLLNLGQDDLNSTFSSFCWKKFIVAFEEISTWQNSIAKDMNVANKLKNFIMSPVIHVNEKYGKKYSIKNTAMFIINSNSETPVYLDSVWKSNRRYSIIKSDKPLDKKLAIDINRVVRNPKQISYYLAWLEKTFPKVKEMKEFVALENKDKEDLINRFRDYSNEFWEYYFENWYSTGRVLVTTINELFSEFSIECWIELASFKKRFWENSILKKVKLTYPPTQNSRWLVEIPESLPLKITEQDITDIFDNTMDSVEVLE
jgi:hypothetical protein